MTLNPRAALIAAMNGDGVTVEHVDPEYRPALQASEVGARSLVAIGRNSSADGGRALSVERGRC